MPSCAFMRCTNHSKRTNKSNGITFHSFPGDELVRHKWILVVRKQRQEPDWTPNQHSRICSTHFKRDDIHTTNKGYRRLSKTAVPFFQTAMLATSSNNSRPTTPNSLNDVDVSDLESVLESPRKSSLKKKLRTLELQKKKLMQSNKNLNKKVKRLTNTCKYLRETVIQLKKYVTEDQLAEICHNAESVDLFKRLLEVYRSLPKRTVDYR